jgi:hypothetical protein
MAKEFAYIKGRIAKQILLRNCCANAGVGRYDIKTKSLEEMIQGLLTSVMERKAISLLLGGLTVSLQHRCPQEEQGACWPSTLSPFPAGGLRPWISGL